MSQVITLGGKPKPGSGPVFTLTGNSGGAVGPDGVGNINTLGGTNINVVGNPGTNTLTFSSTSSMLANNYTNVNTSPYVVLATDYYLSVDCSGGPITVELPNAPTTKQIFIIKDRTGSAGTNNITLTTVGGVVTIDGSTSQVINTNYESMNVLFNGSGYEIF
jgi:hypothetical protein